MEELLRYNFKQRYIVFDTETEGLNLITSKPWQIAWIECEGKKVIKKHNRFIKWDDLNVSPDAARVTGFDRDYYESVAEDPMVVWKDFEKIVVESFQTTKKIVSLSKQLKNSLSKQLNKFLKCTF